MGPERARRARGEHGAGSVLAVAVLGAVVALMLSAAPVLAALPAKQRLEGTADAAALAAGDVVLGSATGEPCEVAARVTAANGVPLGSCRIDDAVVEVTVQEVLLGVPVTARARAGPPT